MSGYKIISEAYKKIEEERQMMSKEDVERDKKTLAYLSSCDEDDIFCLFDSGAFNDITKNYLDYVLHSLTEVNELKKEDAEKIKDHFNSAFDIIDAKTVCQKEWKKPRDY